MMFRVLVVISFISLGHGTESIHVSHSLPGRSSVQITHNFRSSLISENNHENPSFTSSQTPPVVSSHSSPFHPSHSVEKKYSPFNPRFAVERNEISDEEWESELLQSFHESGIVPNVLQSAPKFLINVNFGNYECVHMGTELRAEDSAYPPTSLTFPVSSKHNNNQTLHTLVMLDLDNHNWLHWMLVNIPGTNYKKGTDITDYIGPTPTDSFSHRYILLIMKQNGPLHTGYLRREQGGGICDNFNRGSFDLYKFRSTYGLSEPIAANYFRVRYNQFIDSIIQFCRS
uniref:OV-16 antigen n=1 Tax=Lepeophtheirus salmonis TaxID=72036 RepID=C1BTE4_LEPSM|nr:OV-16 antigen precursor [Lepeophtheirus salmonis]